MTWNNFFRDDSLQVNTEKVGVNPHSPYEKSSSYAHRPTTAYKPIGVETTTKNGAPRPTVDSSIPTGAKFPQHNFRPDGYLELNPSGRHPIYDLIERAQHQWSTKLERQSKTLHEAVVEYKRRYSRSPPPGFDKWCVTDLEC
jgi:hypothetical protein